MQLLALLESIHKHITGLNDIVVLYRASNDRYEAAYQDVYHEFPQLVSIRQENPSSDFKQLTVTILQEAPCEYVLFAVDDIIVKDDVNVMLCIDLLEQTGAYGFYLRLGKNLSYCYPVNLGQPLPAFTEVVDGVYTWQFKSSALDWRYPHTVDMTLYKKEIIFNYFKTLSYNQPNTLEAIWAGHGRASAIMQYYGLCFECSKVVNLPLNKVQTVYDNRCMNCYSPFQLLEKFEEGFKIDIKPLHKIENNSAHLAYVPTFIAREPIQCEEIRDENSSSFLSD
jgi:hypothetical protein